MSPTLLSFAFAKAPAQFSYVVTSRRSAFGAAADGGWGGIRTHETLSRLPVFKTGAFNRSATHPLSPQLQKCNSGVKVLVLRVG
jgi:hypothetical protein